MDRFTTAKFESLNRPTIQDGLGRLNFHIPPRSFFQVNTAQAEVLYNKALEYANLKGEETVIDAYCGTGTITLFLAQKAREVMYLLTEICVSAILRAGKHMVRKDDPCHPFQSRGPCPWGQ